MPLYLEMSENINETTRHLKFRYISILKNYVQLDQLKEIKRTKSILKRNIKML